MSRIRVLGASVAALVACTGVAVAADVPQYGAPPLASYSTPPPSFSWTGPYFGFTGGYGFGGTTILNDGWIGGAYAGANHQFGPNLVVGVEGDLTVTGKSGTSGDTTVSNPWNGTLRGRLGFAMDRFMVYGTGGLAVGRVHVEDTGIPSDESATRVGWTAGAGLEGAITDHVIGRVEYRYTNLGSSSFAPGTISYSSNDIMGGIGFKF